MAFSIVILDNSKEKAIHFSTLRRQSFFKTIKATGTLVAICIAGLMFADQGIERGWQRQAF